MRKALKIAGITLGSIAAIVLLGIMLVCYVLVTPKQLKPIVQQVADSLVTTSYGLEEVDLTLFRTFPHAGLRIRGLYILSPMDGAPTDTLLAAPEIVVALDMKEYLSHKTLKIKELKLKDVTLNGYINEQGEANWEVARLIRIEKDSTDDTETNLPFALEAEHIQLTTHKLTLVDRRDSIDISHLSMALTASAKADQTLQNIEARIKALTIDWDGMQMSVNGEVRMVDGIQMAIDWTSNQWQVKHLLQTMPERFARLVPKEIEIDAEMSMSGRIEGRYDSVTFPMADAHLLVEKGAGHIDRKVLPYDLNEVVIDATLHADLNDKAKTRITINELGAKMLQSNISLSGNITEILHADSTMALGNPLLQMTATMSVHMADANYWIENDSSRSEVNGKLVGQMEISTRLSDITAINLQGIKAKGDLRWTNANVWWQDSTRMTTDVLDMHIEAPKTNTRLPQYMLTADCIVDMQQVHAEVLSAAMDAQIDKGQLHAAITMDTRKAQHRLPTITGGFDVSQLNATIDTIHIHATGTNGELVLSSKQMRNNVIPQIKGKFRTDQLQASLGKEKHISTGRVDATAEALYNKKADNILLKWNPKLHFAMADAKADIAQVGVPVMIPQIHVDYSNREMEIDTSLIVVGRSNFSLGGKVQGIGKWLRHRGQMTGKLHFTSQQTDIDELLAVVNHFNQASGVVETAIDTTAAENSNAEKESMPLMVPKGVDLTLHTHIQRGYFSGDTLTNVRGELYVKDGQLILEEMGFVCEAAKLQLTAIYKTPRPNHLYLGFDFHMVDINLEQLIHMFPQVDTLMPMLNSFKGKAQFHVAAESYLDRHYQLKTPTTRGACSIEGKDLVLLDTETFKKISHILMFSPKRKNLVDSLSVQCVLYKDQLTIYPFSLQLGNYMAALGGEHYLDMTFNYHISLLRPIYLGVDVGGNMDDLKIRAGQCRFAQDFRPIIHRDVETQSSEMKRLVANALHKSLKIESTDKQADNNQQ